MEETSIIKMEQPSPSKLGKYPSNYKSSLWK